METMKCVLNVIYTGKAYLTKAQAEDIEGLMKLLDVKLPGEFKNEECSPLENTARNVYDTPSSSLSSKKRKASGSPTKVHLLDGPGPVPKAPRTVDGEKSHEKLLIEMQLKLMPFHGNKSLDCNVPGCTEKVSHHNMTSHFQQHFHEREKKQADPEKLEIIMFKCTWCPKEFKYRRALDHHKKNFHTSVEQSKKKQVEDLTLPMKDATIETKPTLYVCQYCKQETKSEWHLTPSRHKCPLLPMIEASKLAKIEVQSNATASSEGVICNQCNKRLESSWHMSPSRHNCKIKIKHEEMTEDGNENRNCERCGVSLKSRWHAARHVCKKDGEEISVYDCRICMSVFEDFSNLSSHYTREHYWTRLFEEFKSWENKCSICLLQYPTNDDLIYHMGNVHRKFNKYLKEDGHGTLQILGKFKLDNLKCGMESCPKESERMTLFKLHLCSSHFSRTLQREFTEGDYSPCYASCAKTFPNEAKRLYHIGSFHNEVLKFAAFYFKDTANESVLSNLLDLTEMRKGVTFKKEADKKIKQIKATEEYIIKKSDLNSYNCGKCKKVYRTRTRLKTHIAFSHYKEKLMKTYSGTSCGICERVVESNKLLLKHVAFKHDSVLAYLLGKDGLVLPRKFPKNPQNLAHITPAKEKSENEDEDEGESDSPAQPNSAVNTEPEEQMDISLRAKVKESFGNNQCQICFAAYSNNASLKIHYVTIHYLSKMYENKPDSLTSCPICSTTIGGTHPSKKRNAAYHIAFTHPETLIKCMEDDNLWVGNSKNFSRGENGYDIKKVRIDIKMTEEVKEKAKVVKAKKAKREEKKKRKMQDYFETKPNASPEKPNDLQLALEVLMTCFLCKKDFNHLGQNALLAHFSEEHYRLELEHNYITRPGMMWTTDKRCPQCFKLVETKEQLINHMGVEHRAVEKFLPEKYKLPTIVEKELSFPCPLKNCSSDKETKKALLVHLLIVHYQKDMEREFGPIFYKEGKKKCPKCNMALLDNYLGYMKHIAVEHAYVMNFVERDINGTHIENQDSVNHSPKEETNKDKIEYPKNGTDLLSVLDNVLEIEEKSTKSAQGKLIIF